MTPLPLANILHHKLRSALSMLGIGIGVCMLIALSGLARGIESMAGDSTAIGKYPRDKDNPDFKDIVRHRSHKRYLASTPGKTPKFRMPPIAIKMPT